MRRRRIMLDTNVCGKLLGPAYRLELEAIKKRINGDFDVVASPQTFLELLDTIKGGTGSFFETDKERLRLMTGTGQLSMLAFPATLALRKVLGLKTADVFGPTDFARWLRVVLHAKSRAELLQGDVRIPSEP